MDIIGGLLCRNKLMLSYVRSISVIAGFATPRSRRCRAAGIPVGLFPRSISISRWERIVPLSLQLLDSEARERHGAKWSVSNPGLAEIQEEAGQVVLHPIAAGTVRVSAALGLETRSSDIRIWPEAGPGPEGVTHWGTHSLGRDLGDLPAVPTGDGPHFYSLEQTAGGNTYLRAFTDEGIQVWVWLAPENAHDLELICGDWKGGALLGEKHDNSFTLYTIGKDGRLLWQRKLAGVRKAIAYNVDNLVHVLSQSPDRTAGQVTGIDGVSGDIRFDLAIPASIEKRINVRKAGERLLCASAPSSSKVSAGTSRMIVSSDGLAYLAFMQQEWELQAEKCIPGSVVSPSRVNQTRSQRVVLWQIHPDGTYRSSLVEESRSNDLLSRALTVAQPTGAIIPDGLGGILLSVGWPHIPGEATAAPPPDGFVYRLDENGNVVYQFPLPAYNGRLHDGMLLGQNSRVFVTRGSVLIAFNLETGRELWRWDSHTPDIEAFAALADGSCVLQTPTALVKVANASDAQEIFKGKAMLDWQGRLYTKHN